MIMMQIEWKKPLYVRMFDGGTEQKKRHQITYFLPFNTEVFCMAFQQDVNLDL